MNKEQNAENRNGGERKLNKKLLLAEGKNQVDFKLFAKMREIQKKWNQLFEMCYGHKYRVSKKESGMLKNLCKENPVSEITAAIVAIFQDHLFDRWYLEKNLVPCLENFITKYNQWKAKGYQLLSVLNLHNENWWFVNETKFSLEKLPKLDLQKVLVIKSEAGMVIVYSAEGGKVLKRRVM